MHKKWFLDCIVQHLYVYVLLSWKNVGYGEQLTQTTYTDYTFEKKNCISNRSTNHHSLSITSIFILGECTVSLPQHSVPRQPEKPSKCQAPAWDSTLTMPFHSRQLQHLEKEDAFSLFSLSARCSVIAFHMLPVSRPSLLYFVVSITMVCKGHKTDRPYSASGVFRFGSTSIS